MDSSFPFLMVGAGIYAISVVATFVTLRRAPDGYEDEAGFHFAPKGT